MSEAIVLDVETTGFSPKEARVTNIAVMGLESGEMYLDTLIDPECHIPEHITEITKITDEMVAGKPKFRNIAAKLYQLIQDAEAVIGYNIAFDRRFISEEFRRMGDVITPPKWPPVACAKRMWDVVEPRDSRKLQNAYKRWVNDAGFENAHGAGPDTRATRAVFLSQKQNFPEVFAKPWSELDPEAQTWWSRMTDHIRWKDGRLTVGWGKYRGAYCHTLEKSFWKWVSDNDFPEHVKDFADYMVMIFHGEEPKTETDLIAWATKKEQEL